MRLVQPRPRGRSSFTLIELLVVIAIIGILVALTGAAVLQYMKKGPQMQNVNTIRQLSVALENFKAKFGTYPPSQIFLANTLTQYQNPYPGVTPAQQLLSLNYIQQIWPRIDLTTGVNWSAGAVNTPVLLEGDQCLVFFLGGIQQATVGGNGICLGFSTNPKNPTALPAATGEIRVGPFFEFQTAQLVYPDVPVPAGIGPPPPASFGFGVLTSPSRPAPYTVKFLVYLDNYGMQPYAYFSSGKTANGYNATAPYDCPHLNQPVLPYFPTAGPTLGPYCQNNVAPLRFYNPNTFQIISAGADGRFGAGGIVAPGTAPVNASQYGGAADDFSNFTDGRIGAGL